MWTTVREFEDIRYETTDEGKIAKITINRPEVRNAFRPKTVKELLEAFDLAHEDPAVGVIVSAAVRVIMRDYVCKAICAFPRNISYMLKHVCLYTFTFFVHTRVCVFAWCASA